MAKIEKIFARVMCMVTTVCHYFINFQHKFWCVVCNNMYTNCTGSMESFEEGGMCALHDIAATCLGIGTSRGQRDYFVIYSMHRKIPNMNSVSYRMHVRQFLYGSGSKCGIKSIHYMPLELKTFLTKIATRFVASCRAISQWYKN